VSAFDHLDELTEKGRAGRERTGWFRDYFDAAATAGVLGDSHGQLAYAYLRCSSSGQVEEGRSGLPRQLQHVAEVAQANKLKITWETLYFDDHSGFEFEDRPALSQLRRTAQQPRRVGNVLVIEYLDRLSRNARWHQGYLLDEFARLGIKILFWKSFSSDIERAVMGAIAEQGMRDEIARMVEGTRFKAKSGRITAKVRKFGFVFVDGDGQPTEKARKDTYYALHPEESKIIALAYERIVFDGWSLYQVCEYLEQTGVPTRRNAKHWHTATLGELIRDPIYKGEFNANRFYFERITNPETGRTTLQQRQRPPEEWIRVSVPAVVTPEAWALAQEMIAKKRKTASRNLQRERLLSGYLFCARCGRTFQGAGGSKQHPSMYYYCRSWSEIPSVRRSVYCQSPTVFSRMLDAHIWNTIISLILAPDLVALGFGEDAAVEKRVGYAQQADYLTGLIKRKEQELARWDDGYAAGYLTVDEWGAKHKTVLADIAGAREGLRRIEAALGEVAKLELQRDTALAFFENLRRRGVSLDMPFADKRKILSLLIDRIFVNSVEKWYRLEGTIRGTFSYNEDTSEEAERQAAISLAVTESVESISTL
jgi:site-specific DNA recombinase